MLLEPETAGCREPDSRRGSTVSLFKSEQGSDGGAVFRGHCNRGNAMVGNQSEDFVTSFV